VKHQIAFGVVDAQPFLEADEIAGGFACSVHLAGVDGRAQQGLLQVETADVVEPFHGLVARQAQQPAGGRVLVQHLATGIGDDDAFVDVGDHGFEQWYEAGGIAHGRTLFCERVHKCCSIATVLQPACNVPE